LALATLSGDDIILCQITSKSTFDAYSVALVGSDFVSGGLNRESNVRPNRLFTADFSIVLYKAGHIAEAKLDEAVACLISISK
jgi:mRNA interferase MazF